VTIRHKLYFEKELTLCFDL